MKSVGVIGGGITGLVAALELMDAGLDVTLYEAADELGGVIGTLRKDGYQVERGPNTLLETAPYIGQLISRAGLESERLYSDGRANARYIVRHGALQPVPSSPLAFLRSKLFSSSGKARLFAEPLISRGSPEKDETVADFARRRLGKEFLDYAINPMIAGIYAGDPERLSIREGFPKLHSLESDHRSLLIGQFARARELRARGEVSKQNAPKLSFARGLQSLPEAIGAKLGDRVRLNATVTLLKKENDGWSVSGRRDGETFEARHGAMLLTVPAHKLSAIRLEASPSASLSELHEIPYAPVVTLGLGFKRRDVAHPLDGFGALVPELERLSILGVIFSSTLFPNRAPADHVLVTCYMGGRRQPELVNLSLEEQVEKAMGDLRMLLGVTGQPTLVHRTVYAKAIPQYEIGYGRFYKAMERIESAAPGLFLGGNYRDGIALGDAILNGRKLSGRVKQFTENQRSGPQTSASSPVGQEISK